MHRPLACMQTTQYLQACMHTYYMFTLVVHHACTDTYCVTSAYTITLTVFGTLTNTSIYYLMIIETS